MAIGAEYVNPFVEAAVAVAAKVAGIAMRRDHGAARRPPGPACGVCIVVGVYGYLTGQVVYSMKKDLADKLVDAMLQGCSGAQREDLYSDTLGELANMITGNATAILNKKKELALGITTPAVATGTDLTISLVNNIPALVLRLDSEFGAIEINVALKERTASDAAGQPAVSARSGPL